MTNTSSLWKPRIKELVNLFIEDGIFVPDVSKNTVQQTLNYWAGAKAKQLNSMDRKCPKENPWLASLMLYVCLGDCQPNATFSESTQLEVGVLLGIAERNSWTFQDTLQAIEWIKEAMPFYPTAEQWSTIFNVEANSIIATQKVLSTHMLDLLSPTETIVWTAALNLEAPFYYWAEFNKNRTEIVLSLPTLDVDI